MMRLIVPPLPAVSRPSKITTTRRPSSMIHSCIRTNSICSSSSFFSYFSLLTTFGVRTISRSGLAGWEAAFVALADFEVLMVGAMDRHYGLATRIVLRRGKSFGGRRA